MIFSLFNIRLCCCLFFRIFLIVLWKVGMLFNGFFRVISVLCSLSIFFSFGICLVMFFGEKFFMDLNCRFMFNFEFFLLERWLGIVIFIFIFWFFSMLLKLCLFILMGLWFLMMCLFLCWVKLFNIIIFKGNFMVFWMSLFLEWYLILICFLGVIVFFLDIMFFFF